MTVTGPRSLVVARAMVFGRDLDSVLQGATGERDLDVVELWSGVGSVVSAATRSGFEAVPFDKFRTAGETENNEDILTESGFALALSLVLRLRPGGLLIMAPVCSSWIFLCKHQTGRCKANGYAGDSKCRSVREGNKMAEVAAFLYTVACRRGTVAFIENPPSSTIFRHEPVRQAVQSSSSVVVPRCAFSDEPVGKKFGKKFKFVGNAPWMQSLSRKCLCPNGVHKKTVKENIVGGARKVWGDKAALRESGSYPPRLGQAIVDAWAGPWFDSEGSVHGLAKSKVNTRPRSSPCLAKSKVKAGPRSRQAQGLAKSWCRLPLGDSAEKPRRKDWRMCSLESS